VAFIELNDVRKEFSSQRFGLSVAVADFDLALEKGEFFCLLGPSGCGKTTVLAMLAGFEQPSSGTIQLNGRLVLGPSRDRGVVFQGDDSLFPWLTARENVEFGLRMSGLGRRERTERATHYLNLVNLPSQGNKYPTELSGGMKQRIQIARALANEPEMLLMDEPFGALDAQTREVMQQELVNIWRSTGTSVFFITHDIDEAILLGSRIGVMSAGPGGRLREVIEAPATANKVRSHRDYIECYERIHTMIREEVARSRHGAPTEPA
jgi:NitT/TauT family transport system ATP-binding protein